MLDKQFYNDQKYRKYLNEKFIMIRADRDHKQKGEDLFTSLDDLYGGIVELPTVVISNPDQQEIDRIVGYDAGQSDKYLKK